jgi:hypothetical protein
VRAAGWVIFASLAAGDTRAGTMAHSVADVERIKERERSMIFGGDTPQGQVTINN